MTIQSDRTFLESSSDIYVVARILKAKYGDFPHFNKKNPLDELLFILLSSKTTEKSYLTVYKAFKRQYPRWQQITEANVLEIGEVLKPAGLNNIKAAMISEIVSTLTQKYGKPTLAPLKYMSDLEAEAFLTALPGVGKKIARCVLLYSLQRNVFPVDTHCWRICCRLGLAPYYSCLRKPTDNDMDVLQDVIPSSLRFSLHVNMVSLGRKVCHPHEPNCYECPLYNHCPKYTVYCRLPNVQRTA